MTTPGFGMNVLCNGEFYPATASWNLIYTKSVKTIELEPNHGLCKTRKTSKHVTVQEHNASHGVCMCVCVCVCVCMEGRGRGIPDARLEVETRLRWYICGIHIGGGLRATETPCRHADMPVSCLVTMLLNTFVHFCTELSELDTQALPHLQDCYAQWM